MYWVVKWATLRKPKLIRIGPQGAHPQEGPNERPKPTWTIKESTTNEDLGLCQWTRDIHALSRQMTHGNKTQAYMHGPLQQSTTNEDSGLSSLLSSMKAHRRAKAQQEPYPSSKQAQVHARRPAGSVQIQSPSKVAPHMKSWKGSEPI